MDSMENDATPGFGKINTFTGLGGIPCKHLFQGFQSHKSPQINKSHSLFNRSHLTLLSKNKKTDYSETQEITTMSYVNWGTPLSKLETIMTKWKLLPTSLSLLLRYYFTCSQCFSRQEQINHLCLCWRHKGYSYISKLNASRSILGHRLC